MPQTFAHVVSIAQTLLLGEKDRMENPVVIMKEIRRMIRTIR